MDAASKNDRLVRFSIYELDRDSGELFKQGRKVKLQGQPFELLVALLERPGEVLTREELRQRIWSSETAGDFDQGLNRAINKIREALGDSAENPRFIETLPRRGYRFMNSMASPPPAVVEQSSPVAIEQPIKSRRKLWIIGAILASILAVITAAIWMLLHRSSSRPIQLQQLTTNSSENPILHAVISPDGKYLAYGDLTGIQVRLISTGESYTLPKPAALSPSDIWAPQAWFPDGTHLLASSEHSTPNEKTITTWNVSVVGGSAVPLREGALAQSISPDGSTIAFTSGGPLQDWTNAASTVTREVGDIWVMNSQGGAAKKIVTAGAGVYVGSVRWSPDGKRVAYQELRFTGGQTWDCAIKSVDTNGAATSLAVSYRQDGTFLNLPADFVWLPDDRIVYAVAENSSASQDTNLWQIRVDRRSVRALGQPQKLTNLAGFHMTGFSSTTDGKHLVFESTKERSRIQLGRLDATGKLVDARVFTLDERNNLPFVWTADSKSIIFSSDRTGKYALYRQTLDAKLPELIRTGPESIPMTRLSPDGNHLIYAALSNVKFPDQSDSVRFMSVPLTGGPAALLFDDKSNANFACPQRSGLPCFLSNTDADGKQQTFFSFDPVSGLRHQLFKVFGSSLELVNWNISPAGSKIALVRYDPRAHIEILSLDGRIEKKFDVKGWPDALSIDWAADGKALFVSSRGLMKSPSGPIGTTLLRVDLEGNAQPIWETTTGRICWGIASPDGKYLAIWQPATEGNIWRLDGF